MDSDEWQKCWIVANIGKYKIKTEMVEAQVRAAVETGIPSLAFPSVLCPEAKNVCADLGFDGEYTYGRTQSFRIDLTRNKKDPTFVSCTQCDAPLRLLKKVTLKDSTLDTQFRGTPLTTLACAPRAPSCWTRVVTSSAPCVMSISRSFCASITSKNENVLFYANL